MRITQPKFPAPPPVDKAIAAAAQREVKREREAKREAKRAAEQPEMIPGEGEGERGRGHL